MIKSNNINVFKTLIASVLIILGSISAFAAYGDKNLIVNGDFEAGTAGWITYGGSTTYKSAYDGRNSMIVSQNGFEWVGAHQIVDISGFQTVKLFGGVRAAGVKTGKESWQKARISLEFLDKNGTPVFAEGTEYTPALAEATGKSGWVYNNQVLKVPAGATQLQIAAVLANASGTAYFDEIEVYGSEINELEGLEFTLQNGGFESSSGWTMYGGVVQNDVSKVGKNSLKISQEETEWYGGHQEVVLKEEWNQITVSGWAKSEGVKEGDANWKKARLGIDFIDVDGGNVGGNPSPAVQMTGDNDWIQFKSVYAIPKGAVKTKISPVLAHASGTVYFDDLQFLGENYIAPESKWSDAVAKGIQNPSFEAKLAKWAGGTASSDETHSGDFALELSLPVPNWTGSDQIIILPQGVSKLNVSSYVKTKNISKGDLDYERCRIAVEFLDATGVLTGGYQSGIGNLTGDNDWTKIDQDYNVPPNAKTIKITPQLANVSGTAYFDDMEVKYYGSNGETLAIPSQEKIGPLSSSDNYYALEIDPNVYNTHWVDWSNLLEAPAGQHGFVKVKGADMFFEDGKQAKFWGVNIVGKDNFPTKEIAKATAERLAKMGCNVARLHHLDAPWATPNIFGNSETTTRTLDPEMVDRLDFFVSELKKRGVYVFLDLLVHRKFLKEDGVPQVPQENGAKQVGQFNRIMIDLQKEYAQQLITHKNKYTNMTYADDPVVMGSIIMNETTIFFYFNGDVMNPIYRKELQERFNKYTGRTDLTLAVFSFDYGVQGGMNALQGNPEEVRETIAFYKKLEYEYYEEMSAYIKNDLKAKFPVSGTNMPLPQTVFQEVNAKAKGLDFVAVNNYWDHPKVHLLNNDWSRQLYAPIDNRSLLRTPKSSLSNHFSKFSVHNRPLFVTEYNACFPNEWRLEAIPMVSAYSKLQGIDGLCQFDFRNEPVGKNVMQQAFSLSKQPSQLAQWVMAAPIMLGDGYLKEAPGRVVDPVSEKETSEFPAYNSFMDDNNHLTYITKVAMSFDGKSESSPSDYSKYANFNTGVFKSETNELEINTQEGLLVTNSPKVQGVTGSLGKAVTGDDGSISVQQKTFDLPFFSLESRNMWASCNLISKDGKPLAESKSFIISAVTPCRQKDLKFNDQRTQLDELGNNEWQAQYFEGKLTINKTGKFTVTPKTVNGKPLANVPTTQSGGKTIIDLSKAKSFIFEVTVE